MGLSPRGCQMVVKVFEKGCQKGFIGLPEGLLLDCWRAVSEMKAVLM